MSYNDVAQMATTSTLQNRVTACVATEGEPYPVPWMGTNIWAVVAAPGWGAAWSYAIATGMTPDEAGADEGVITDSMILSQVQTVRAEAEPKNDGEPVVTS